MKAGTRGSAIFEARRRREEYVGQLALSDEIAARRIEGWTADDWATPWDLVRSLEDRFGPFDLDPACEEWSAKAPAFYTPADDGLSKPWFGRVFLNPPFSYIVPWLMKAQDYAASGGEVVVLLPVRTDMDWWHDIVWPNASIEFMRGRPRFIGADGAAIGRPWFAVCIAHFFGPREAS